MAFVGAVVLPALPLAGRPLAAGAAPATTSTVEAGKAQVLWTAAGTDALPQRGAATGPLVVRRGADEIAGLTPATGSTLWQDVVGPTFFSLETVHGATVVAGAVLSGVVAGGTVFVLGPIGASPVAGARVLALDQADGHRLWSASSPEWLLDGITAGSGVVVVSGDPLTTSTNGLKPSTAQSAYVLDAASGSVLWHDEPSGRGAFGSRTRPFVADGLVLVPSHTQLPYVHGPYTALDARTGHPVWTAPVACLADVGSTWHAGTQVLLLTCGVDVPDPWGGNAVAVDPTTGAQLWSTSPLGPDGTADAVVGIATGTVYLGGGTSTVAFDEATGRREWTAPGSFVGRDGSLVFTVDGVRTALTSPFDAGRVVDATTGAVLGSFAFASGWAPVDGLSMYSGAEALGSDGSGISGIELPTAGWTPPTVALAATPDGGGYWLAGQDGGVFSYGDAPFEGSLPGLGVRVDDIVGMAATPDGDGYWEVASDGGVFAFGDAQFYGSAATLDLLAPIVGMAATPDGRGYWLVAADGGVFAFGDAQFYGSVRSTNMGWFSGGATIWPTPDGGGYWVVGYKGDVAPFGDAAAFTGGGNVHLPADPVGGAVSPGGTGIWYLGQDGGVFTGAGAPFEGSVPGASIHITDAVGITPSPDGRGYWVVGTDGGVFAFGDAQFYGSRG